ncbi:MAG TPA: aminopeptidase, partial [Caulobacteraceae bacterium]
MFGKIAWFEFRYQLRQVVFWVAVAIFGLLAFGSVASDNIRLGGTDNVHRNGPFVIAAATLFFSEIYMFVVAALVANVIVRDEETGFGGIIRSTRIRKADYLYGRFAGAFGAALVGYLAVPIGLWLGSSAWWVDHETLGPLVIAHYVWAYVVLAAPVIFLTSALFFAVTTVSRSMMWTYVGVVVLFIGGQVLGVVLRRPGYEHIAALWEPFGAGAFGAATRYWTPYERNTQLPAIAGDFLAHLLIWLGIGLSLLAAAYALFRFQASGSGRRARRRAALTQAAAPDVAPQALFGKGARPVFDARAARAQLWARTKLDAAQVFKSPAYFVLLGLAAALSAGNLWFSTEVGNYGGKIYPVSRVMMQALSGIFPFMTLIIATYYAGELVWREKERRTHEIIDATPTPDWMFVLPKTLAISIVTISTLLAGVVVSIISQALRGYDHFQISAYLVWWVVPTGIDLVLIAVLAIFVQTLVPHKFVGWAVMVLYLISTIVLNNIGFEDNLYQYGGGPTTPTSDMNGLGHFWIGAYWFRVYWSAFALMLLVLAYGLWRRGTETRLRPRLRQLPRRLT